MSTYCPECGSYLLVTEHTDACPIGAMLRTTEQEEKRVLKLERDLALTRWQLTAALAAVKALTCWSMNGEQLCFRSHHDVPMGMSKKQERLARAALATREEEKL